MSKEGSTISGMMDAFATSISIALQYGVPLRTLVKKFIHTRYEPAGMTNNPRIRMAKSITDYLFRWMALKFLTRDECVEAGINIDLEQTLLDGVSHEGDKIIDMNKDMQPALKVKEVAYIDNAQITAAATAPEPASANTKFAFINAEDSPACCNCGSIMVRSASCYKCLNCGNTSGCS